VICVVLNMKKLKKDAGMSFARRGGFTLVELLIVLFFSVVILAVSARLFLSSGSISSISDYFVNQETQTRYTAERINNAIKFTNALFTIPQKSFNYKNLTEGWSYLGVMDNVFIPYRLIEQKNSPETVAKYFGDIDEEEKDEIGLFLRALVYIKYIGSQTYGDDDYTSLDVMKQTYNVAEMINQEALSVSGNFGKEPYDQYVYAGNVSDGYFLVTIIDYELFDDRLGYSTHYELVFDTTNESKSGNIVSGSLEYIINVTYLDDNGKVIGKGRSIELETMLNGVNILQAVYLSSGRDPATAIAFHEGGFKVDAVPHLNVIFVLDLSGSMDERIPTAGGGFSRQPRRIEALADNVGAFINAFKQYTDTVYVGFVEFETYGKVAVAPAKISDSSIINYSGNLARRTPSGGTNLGDGFRIAYSQLQKIVEKNPGAANVILKISDGFTNAWSVKDPSIIAGKIDDYNLKRSNYKLSESYKYKYITADEIGGVDNYYFDTSKSPNVILYLDGSTHYVFYKTPSAQSYNSWNFNLRSDYNSLRSRHSVSLSSNSTKLTFYLQNKESFSYTVPTTSQLRGSHLSASQKYEPGMDNYTIAKDYAAFCLGKIYELSQQDPKYAISAFYDIYVNARSVEQDESKMIQDALNVGQSRTEYYSFTIDNTSEFSEAIGRIISNINTAAWLLESPRV